MSLFGWAIQRFFTSAMDRCGPNGLIARGTVMKPLREALPTEITWD
jgi:hypothetical protein